MKAGGKAGRSQFSRDESEASGFGGKRRILELQGLRLG